LDALIGRSIKESVDVRIPRGHFLLKDPA